MSDNTTTMNDTKRYEVTTMNSSLYNKDTPIQDRLREVAEHPVSGWVKSRGEELSIAEIWIGGEDPANDWVVLIRDHITSSDVRVEIYPPEEDPYRDIVPYDEMGPFEDEEEAREAVNWYFGVTGNDQ